MANFNVWQPQGTVIPAVGSDAPEQPTVFYESGAHILSPNLDGKIFKMWFTTGPAATPIGINYAESNDGIAWTRYGSNPVVASQWGGRVFENGSTYYLYSSATVQSPAGIKVRTSSDGLTWSAPASTGLVPSGVGGTWNDIGVGQLSVIAVIGGTWYGYYWGQNSLTGSIARYDIGLATSTDGINWTESAGNPIAAFHGGTFLGGQSWVGDAAPAFTYQNGVYYSWGQIVALPGSDPTFPLIVPSDILRWVASSPTGPWIPLGVVAYSRNAPSEGFPTSGATTTVGQVADPCLIEVSGSSYLYYTAAVNGNTGTGYVINCAKAPSMTLAQVVATYEGVQNFPLNGDPSLNLEVLASDTFNRANGALGSNWITLTSTFTGAAKILSDSATAAVVGTPCDSTYNRTWANDQWAQVTVQACANASYVGVVLRETVFAASQLTGYRLYWNGTLGTSGTAVIQRVIANSFTTLASASFTLHTGDVILGVAVGTNIFLFVNGVIVLSAGDSAGVSVGGAGFFTDPITAFADTAVINWSGGDFVSAPAITFSISGSAGHAGALVSYTGTASGSVTADGSGNYTISGLAPGTYTLTPTLAGFTFSPTSATEIYAGSDITGVNFTATANTYSISGNAGHAGATISWSGTASGSTTADGSGNYTIPSLANGSYTITPSLAGFTFAPASRSEVVSGSNITGVNFTAVSKGYAMLPIPTLLQPGQNGYFFGSYSANKPNPNFEVTATSGNGTTATINAVQREGFTPAVGDLITVTGTTQASGGFNVSGVALSAVSLDPVTGIGTLSYLCTASASSAPDFGNADVLNGEAAATLVNGASKSVAVQTAAGQNDNGKNIAWTVSYKAGAVAPMAVTASLQGALVDQDSEYTTIASTTVTDSANLVISNVTQRFYRVLISNLSGGSSKIISKITI